MTPNFRSLTLIGIAALIMATAANAYAQGSDEGEDWLSVDQEPQSSHTSSLDSSSPPVQESSYPAQPDSFDASLPDSSYASPPDSSDMPPSDFSDTPSLDASSQSSPDQQLPSPEDLHSSDVETVHISAKEYHPKANQIEYPVPESPIDSSPKMVTPAPKDIELAKEVAKEEPSLQTPPVKNSLSKPENPTPDDGARDQPLNPILAWSGNDDGRKVTYTVYMGTSPTSMPEEYTVVKNSLVLPVTLDQATTYYWKVEASDGDETSTGDVWSFTTQDRPNRPPNGPQDPVPMNGAKDIPINPTISWSGEDPDGDTVEYTVYLSTNSSSEPLEYKARGKTLSISSNLSGGITYYWKVEASDGKLTNTSDTWSFTTQSEPNCPPNKARDPKPDNYAKDQPTNPVLSWEGEEDPDGDPVTYKVFMGPTLNQMTQIYNGPERNCSAPTSNYGVTNFWKVEASDGKLVNSSDVWSFTTKGQPVWEQPNTVNALIGAIIAVVGGLAANYVKGRKK
jgi:hypothetical protein